MKPNSADVTFVLDRSSSMIPIADETVKGVRHFINEQRKLPGECRLSLVLFDDRIERPFTAVHLGEAPEIELVPRGCTALLDAIGSAIEATGKRLDLMAESEKPSQVILVIVTDGYENASHSYSNTKIAEMIAHHRDTYQWSFVFLGANQDAIATASKLSISPNAALNFAANAGGVRAAYANVSSVLDASRTSGKAIGVDSLTSFSDHQRNSAMKSDIE